MKKDKEELMKKLTVAYENNDLHTLLSIEIDWINRSENSETNGAGSCDKNLKIYNSILKDQISEIQANNEMEFLNPKYLPIQRYINEICSPISLMLEEFEEIEYYLDVSNHVLKMLKGSDVETVIKKNILGC